MKIKYILGMVLPLIFSCNSTSKNMIEEPVKIICEPTDKEILNKVLTEFADKKELSVSTLVNEVGIAFLNTPYAEHTLEHEPEQLVVNLREMDCTTFIENCLAIARTVKSDNPGFEQFAKELLNIRYQEGKINGYTSRLHYFSDWIFTNEQKLLVKNVSREIAETKYNLMVNFMSTHPESYKQLADSSLIPLIAATEKEISAREMYYIPKSKLAEAEDKLLDGDIAAITTDIAGLDISHTALLISKNGRIHILHASSNAGKVIVSEETLEDYLQNNKRATGIMVARPK